MHRSEVIDILNTELNKLCNTDVTRSFKIGIVNHGFDNLIKNVKEERCNVPDINNEIEGCDMYSCFSVEYPAVIVLYDVSGPGLTSLYLQISRARVYCVVIAYSSLSGINLSQFNDMLVKLGDSVTVIRYN